MEVLGPDNAYWDDGEWISWDVLDREENEHRSELERLEYEAQLRFAYPKADIALVPYFRELLYLAKSYFQQTGKHLQLYGDIGELFGAISHGIKLHKNYAEGSDGRLGNDFVEIKTITPFNTHDRISVRLTGHFSKLLVVRIDGNFSVSSRLLDRKSLPRRGGKELHLNWAQLSDLSHISSNYGY